MSLTNNLAVWPVYPHPRARRRISPHPRLRAALILSWVAVLLALSSVPATAAEPSLVFTILRNGNDLGWQTATVRRDGAKIEVETQGLASYKIGSLVLYRYKLRRTEIWQDGKLALFSAWTDDDGKVSEVHGRREGDAFRVVGPAGETMAPGGALPGNFWNNQILRASHIIDNETGQAAPIKVVKGELETVEVCGGPVQARRYQLTGKETQNLWYDESGRWVRMELTARDMSKIEFVLRAAAPSHLALSGSQPCGR